jgi:preprotein translocase subunit YajC
MSIIRTFISAAAILMATTANAWAAGGDAQSGFAQLVPLILIMVIFWFLLIRPQQKRVKEHRNMIEAIKKGDKVVTSGGIIGTVTDIKDNLVKVEIADNVRVQVKRDTIAGLAE